LLLNYCSEVQDAAKQKPAMCDFPEISTKTALTLALSHRKREPEMSESPSPWGEGLAGLAPLREEGKLVASRVKA